jgi:hypothetical protein
MSCLISGASCTDNYEIEEWEKELTKKLKKCKKL